MILRLLLLCFGLALGPRLHGEDLRLGIIGSDTSHVPTFTKLFNDPQNPNHVPGARVVCLHKSFSPDLPNSVSRYEEIAREVSEKWGVALVDTIGEMLGRVDAILIESVDGRVHLDQARAVFAAGKPVFIDKPIAASLKDAQEIFRLAAAARCPVFSASSYRFYSSLTELKKKDLGELRSAISIGPCPIDPTHPDLFWYGTHATEALYTVLGTGCQSVTRTSTESSECVTGIWENGRLGIFHGLRNGPTPHKVLLYGSKGVAEQQNSKDGYHQLLEEMVKFFRTGVAPVSPEQTLEILAFMEAADLSKRAGGRPVKLSEVLNAQ